MNIKDYYMNPGEKPLDIIKADGGFTGIFRTVACIGDSLSSGEFESTNADGSKGYHDMYEYSWGQYIARAAGTKVYIFSAGGMTAGYYTKVWADDRGFWDPSLSAQAYIIALGVNDIINQNQPIGTVDDIDFDDPDNTNETFASVYGSIIAKYRKISPRARFFLMTMPRESDGKNDKRENHAALLNDIANRLEHTYVIDLFKYAPVYDEDFHSHFYLGGHLNPAGYLLTANIVMSYIDYIIRSNPRDFADVGFIGTEHYYSHALVGYTKV